MSDRWSQRADQRALEWSGYMYLVHFDGVGSYEHMQAEKACGGMMLGLSFFCCHNVSFKLGNAGEQSKVCVHGWICVGCAP